MRVPLAWLAEWIDLPDPAELEHQLTQGGLEVESDEEGAPSFEGIVVAHVVEREQHPDADRLSLCRVDPGDGEVVDVVCGAPNVRAGLKVAFAPPGTRLPDGTKLKRSKIRGVVSNGMICSARELGLGEDHSGILELDETLDAGRPFAKVAPRDDRVLEIALTPNRGDCASLLGVAREVRAHFGGALRIPETAVEDESGDASETSVAVDIADPAGCYRYVGRLVRGVQIGPSPEWVQTRLEAAGIRAINNAVDVTNLVLLEFGQPLHAFDARTLRGSRILVRRARTGEKLVTLDGESRSLDADDLVIADAERPVALAGVMGGAETEVSETTEDVLLEAAHFDPASVRRSARRHGLSTEASYRFERGVDREGLDRAIDRAARLLAELAGGKVAPGRPDDAGDPPPALDPIEIHPDRVNRLLGTTLEAGTMRDALTRLDIAVAETPDGLLRCAIPSHRNDLRISADLVEEVARIVGYENIDATLPVARVTPAGRPRVQALAETARDVASGLGWIECMTLPMESEAAHDLLGLDPADPRRRAVALQNPLVDDERLLRTSLVPSVLEVLRLNLARQRPEVRVFEIGHVFGAPEDAAALPTERLQLVLALAGRADDLWGHDTSPFYAVKGAAERIFDRLGLTPRWKPDAKEPFFHPGASARAELSKTPIAALGELHPAVAGRAEIDAPCAILVLDLAAVSEQPPHAVRYTPVSRQPSVRRDLALLVDRGQAAGAVVSAVRQKGGPLLQEVDLFDRYEGKGVPEGKLSLGVRLVFQHAERTLTEAEVAKATDRVVRALAQQFGAELR